MLNEYQASVTLATKDMDASRAFYTKTLGLVEKEVDDEGLAVLTSGGTTIYLYPAGAQNLNGGTVCTWFVGKRFDEVLKTLQHNGVAFEHYDGVPGMSRDGDTHILTKIQRKAAWFKDPSGNILSIAGE
jgi:catechol 2,3-dioxygenase-like lactoylglutathione lyase family enzyme